MSVQMALTALLVVGCAGYAVWSLMPAALRRRLAARLGRPVPASGGACGGCDGCGSPARKAEAPGTSVVRIVRQPRRD